MSTIVHKVKDVFSHKDHSSTDSANSNDLSQHQSTDTGNTYSNTTTSESDSRFATAGQTGHAAPTGGYGSDYNNSTATYPNTSNAGTTQALGNGTGIEARDFGQNHGVGNAQQQTTQGYSTTNDPTFANSKNPRDAAHVPPSVMTNHIGDPDVPAGDSTITDHARRHSLKTGDSLRQYGSAEKMMDIPSAPHHPPPALGTLDPLPQTIRAKIFTLALQGGAEIAVSEDLEYTVPRHALAILQTSKALRDEVLQSAVTFVFKRPAALKLFLSGGFSSFPLLSPHQISSVRLVILDALETVKLEWWEQAGSKGPHTTPLFGEWADSALHLPSTVKVVEFDLQHSFPLRFYQVGRLVQRMSTTIHVRSKRFTQSRTLGCRTPATQKFVEECTCALVGPTSGFSGRWDVDDDYYNLARSVRDSERRGGDDAPM
ncbi:hypothetical protein FQN54_003548 [Arachnomyces sp. PD_36]|nr:hypothetical protein FQN54_003548 [Arachnomyces sp. PD_36]